jgi:CheY-like chemotaxis protein/HPt (histidine-containing phosphotransfer) domain-containing protein
VLNNFVSNAVKFTPQGQVEIRTDILRSDADTQDIRFSVVDTGVGIVPEEQERLFAPFVQVGDGGRLAGGTGLGLVISRRLVELMGGTVELASEVGKGTTVQFTIRVRTASAEQLPPGLAQRSAELQQQAAQIRPAPGAAQAVAEGTLVLLVDDHPVNRSVLQQQLQTLGYAADTAADGIAALAAWESGRYALVMTDCQMPGMDGYELARRIREREAVTGRPRTPIIACTAMAIAGEVERCMAAGMDDCVVKPVQLLQLQEMLQKWRPLAAPTGTQDAAIDLPFLQASWGADAAAVQGILESYARSAREDRAALREAWLRRDLGAVVEGAHRMLGASKMVGAHGLAQACTRLNAAGRGTDWAAVALAMGAFEAEYARLKSELDAMPGLRDFA